VILEHRDDLAAFRAAVRTWVRDTVTPAVSQEWEAADHVEQIELQKWFMAERNKVGLATPEWPVEYGGAGLTLDHQIVIADEFLRAGAPSSDAFIITLNHLPSTLIAYGTEEQKRKYLPTAAQGAIWCQGFSEPSAGSDLANIRTKAVRDGDHYVINGQKIWSSKSMYADYCLLLARTDSSGKKQQGISYFIMDMRTPGIEVREIRKSTGGSNFAEMFLTDVRIPVEDLIGEENHGWSVSQATLASERGVLNFDLVERDHIVLLKLIGQAVADDADWLKDAELRRDFARIFAEQQALRRQIRTLLYGPHDAPGKAMLPAFIKLARSTLLNRLGDLMVRAGGHDAQFGDGDHSSAMYHYLDSYGATISAGSNEIMRNLISERGLGMPR
jgi:alkylation response protein AidB-like acyl-CoA dehydrogenase